MAIVKILARHSPAYRSLIQYILNEGKTDKAEIYANNLRSTDIKGYLKEFVENEAFRRQSRSDQIYLYHEIISFSANEQMPITKEMVDDLVVKYMELRGNTGVMLGAAHRDKGHVHVHFCVSGLHFRTGKSFGLSKAQLHGLKVAFQGYHEERYPELANSLPEHGKRGRHVSHPQWHRQRRGQIIATVKQCFAQARSQQQFLDLLREQDFHHYERNGKPTGIQYEGLKFRFSRLFDGKSFEDLPIERSEEEKVLKEIQSIRNQQKAKDRSFPELEK